MKNSSGNSHGNTRANPLASHDYIVLLVLENRTFNNLFGFLDKKGTCNLLSSNVKHFCVDPNIPPTHEFVPTFTQKQESPPLDPIEEYQGIYECFTNQPWRFDSPQLSSLDHLPMTGFTTSYAKALREQKVEPSIELVQEIVNVLPPERIPILTFLAKHFALCDHYFADVCSNTLSNRAFLQSAHSQGMCTNQNYFGMVSWLHNQGLTLYDLLSEKKVPWKVYYDTHNVVPTSFLLNYPSTKHHKDHFHSLDQFFIDCEKHNLPSFSMIEPRFLAYPNDMHPCDSDSIQGHDSIMAAEKLIAQIYYTIQHLVYRRKILFIITFDEGGGLADHVPPPKCVSPYPIDFPCEMKFDFQRLGQRVPTLFISEQVPSCVIHTDLQHTSLIKTLLSRFDIHKSINPRDRHAPLYPNVFNPTLSRSWPMISLSTIPHLPLGMSWNRILIDSMSRWLSHFLFQDSTHDVIDTRLYYFEKCSQWLESLSTCSGSSCFSTPCVDVRFYLKTKVRSLCELETQHKQNMLHK
jgi:phospholipase C